MMLRRHKCYILCGRRARNAVNLAPSLFSQVSRYRNLYIDLCTNCQAWDMHLFICLFLGHAFVYLSKVKDAIGGTIEQLGSNSF